MLERWRQRAIQMNFKYSAVLYGNFKVRTDRERSAFINRRYCTYSRLRYNRSRACAMVLAALHENRLQKNVRIVGRP